VLAQTSEGRSQSKGILENARLCNRSSTGWPATASPGATLQDLRPTGWRVRSSRSAIPHSCSRRSRPPTSLERTPRKRNGLSARRQTIGHDWPWPCLEVGVQFSTATLMATPTAFRGVTAPHGSGATSLISREAIPRTARQASSRSAKRLVTLATSVIFVANHNCPPLALERYSSGHDVS